MAPSSNAWTHGRATADTPERGARSVDSRPGGAALCRGAGVVRAHARRRLPHALRPHALRGCRRQEGTGPEPGLVTELRDGRPSVKHVRADGRARHPLDAHLATLPVGHRVRLTLFRRDLLCTAEAVLAACPFERYRVDALKAPAAERALLEAWLGQRVPASNSVSDTAAPREAGGEAPRLSEADRLRTPPPAWSSRPRRR